MQFNAIAVLTYFVRNMFFLYSSWFNAHFISYFLLLSLLVESKIIKLNNTTQKSSPKIDFVKIRLSKKVHNIELLSHL